MVKRPFTLVDVMIVIVVLGIIATVSVPKFFDKSSTCKRALGVIRSAIANYHVYKSTPAGGPRQLVCCPCQVYKPDL